LRSKCNNKRKLLDSYLSVEAANGTSSIIF